MTTIDMRTAAERNRCERDRRICESYTELSQAFPGYRPTRIMRHIAEEVEMTMAGVRTVLVRAGLVTPRTRRASSASAADATTTHKDTATI